MNKKLLILIIVLAVLIVILIIIGIFSFFKKPKIVETKTFLEISGFSFEYPEFKGWEVSLVKKMSDNEYLIFFKAPFETAIAPSMKIEKVIEQDIDETNFKKSPNGSFYYFGDKGELIFNGPFFVTIYPYMHEGDGYSGKVLVNKIIETFRFDK